MGRSRIECCLAKAADGNFDVALLYITGMKHGRSIMVQLQVADLLQLRISEPKTSELSDQMVKPL